MDFVCPKCSLALVCEDGIAKCKNNHSYDRAKAGYYNLLLTNVVGTHGDNREMVEARRDFLDTGVY
jgi:23S rRNA (guanine745-N1)-methyltransferase